MHARCTVADSLQWTVVGMVDGVTSIDVPELLVIGEAVTGVAGRLDRVAGEVEGWKSSANHAVEGSPTCMGALADAASHWRGTLTELAAEIRDYGAELRQAAIDYRTTDELVARRYRGSAYFADAADRQATP